MNLANQNSQNKQRMEVETESWAAELAAALEHAALMAKQLPSAADQSQLLRIQSALHAAHHRLSLFLSQHPQPEEGEPMQMEGGDAEEEVAWRMRECFIQNKRPKRHLSPSAAEEDDAPPGDFDPLRTRLRALDLIPQFHA